MKRKNGFTIIEVVLVLAIAGLIFLMVFVAVPALQQSQRNTQRRQDLNLIQAALLNYKKYNPNNPLTDDYELRFEPNGFCTFYNRYLSDLKDPSTGRPYRVALWKTYKVTDCSTDQYIIHANEYDREGADTARLAVMGEPGEIQYNDSALCDGEVSKDVVLHSHSYTVRMYLEGGQIACIDAGTAIKTRHEE